MAERKKSKAVKVRMQFDFSEVAIRCLDEIGALTDSSSRSETIRNALQCYEWLISLREEGLKFYARSKKGGGEKELIFLKGFGSPQC